MGGRSKRLPHVIIHHPSPTHPRHIMALPLGAEPPLPPSSLSCSLNGPDGGELTADSFLQNLAVANAILLEPDALERWKIRELCEGFPCHRDACEWTKVGVVLEVIDNVVKTYNDVQMRALFAADDAYVFTTWSGGVPIDDFIKISQKGFEKGVKIAVSFSFRTHSNRN